MFLWEVNGRAGGIQRSQPAVSRDDRTRRSELRSSVSKNRVGGQKDYHESGPLERKGSVVARSSLLHAKNNVFLFCIYIQELLRGAEMYTDRFTLVI